MNYWLLVTSAQDCLYQLNKTLQCTLRQWWRATNYIYSSTKNKFDVLPVSILSFFILVLVLLYFLRHFIYLTGIGPGYDAVSTITHTKQMQVQISSPWPATALHSTIIDSIIYNITMKAQTQELYQSSHLTLGKQANKRIPKTSSYSFKYLNTTFTGAKK